jgi:hypothetical protein
MLGFVDHVIDGKPYSFPQLPAEQVIELATLSFAERRAGLISDLAEANVSADAKLAALDKLREWEGSHTLFIDWLKTTKGSHEVLVRAVPVEVLSAWKPMREEAFDLAALLCGYVLDKPKVEDDNDGFKDDRPT